MDNKPRGRRPGSRNYTDAFRQQVVREAKQADTSVAEVALAHGLNSNMVSHWLRRYAPSSDSVLQKNAFVPVQIKPDPVQVLPSLLIEHGDIRITLDGGSDVNALRAVLTALRAEP